MPGKRFESFKVMWQKESKKKDALYVDIRAPRDAKSSTYSLSNYEAVKKLIKVQPKDNELSTKYRKEGNGAFAEKNWSTAARLYNKSLCFAETGTQNEAFAYANRANCFFNVGEYEKCLVDIELAKKANYPQQMMLKLDTRKAECFKRILFGEQRIPHQPKLSFKPHDKFPSMANVLEIKKDDKFGRHIVTNEDIDVGNIVLIEKSYVSKAMVFKLGRCNICLKSDTNLVPCKKCTTDLFCVGECENHYLHEFECGMATNPIEAISDAHVHVLRSILNAIHTVPNVDSLMEFVEEVIAGEPMRVPEHEPTDNLSKYRVFLELSFSDFFETFSMFKPRIHLIYKALTEHPSIDGMFPAEKHKRFLKHLIAHHAAAIHFNSRTSLDVFDSLFTNDLQPLIASYFNHSCGPNVATVIFDDLQVAIAIRPIKKGEQLVISYHGENLYRTNADNQRNLSTHFGFECACDRCTSPCTHLPKQPTHFYTADERCRYVVANYHNKKDQLLTLERAKHLLDNCIEFTKQFGREKWTEEMSLVISCFIHVLTKMYKYKIFKV